MTQNELLIIVRINAGFVFTKIFNTLEISRFYRIIICIFFSEQNPPHFHVKYQEFEAVIDIEHGVVHGDMPRRALNLVFDWLDLHKSELLENWKRIEERKPLFKIEPLK